MHAQWSGPSSLEEIQIDATDLPLVLQKLEMHIPGGKKQSCATESSNVGESRV